MKNYILLLPLFALLVAACAPLAAAEPAPSPFTLSADGLFSGSAQNFLVTEGELGGQYVQAFPAVRRTNMFPSQAQERQEYYEATGTLDGWLLQFSRPLGGDPNAKGPSYVVSTAYIYSTLNGPHIAMSPNWLANYYEAINTGILTELPDRPNIKADHIVFRYPDGIVTVVLIYRNLTLGFFGKGLNPEDDYQFFTDLAQSHLEWIKSQEQ